MTRDERQDLAIELYVKSNGKGTFNHCTGFGKTHETRKIIKRLKAKWGDDLCYIVIVPTSDLHNQWNKVLDEDSHQVMTIQSLLMKKEELKNNKLKCFFLVIDEIHKMAADQFKQVFELIEYKAVLGLTATYKRLDGKEEIIDKYCPVVDTISLEEARRNGWVANFTEYNWGIDFTDEERVQYNDINKQIDSYYPIFNAEYSSVVQCCSTFGAKNFIRIYNPEIKVEGLKLQGQALLNAITEKANICRELFQKRKDLIGNSIAKIDAVVEAIHYLKMKTITFGLSTNTADVITDKIGEDKAISYHSNIQSRVMILPNKAGVDKPRKVGKDTLLKMLLADFDSDKYKVMNTAKKADLGLDVKGLQCAIIYDGTTDPGTHDQRRGRVTRKEGDKEAIILNIYIKNTKDESYLKQRQKNSFRVRWIDKISQIEK